MEATADISTPFVRVSIHESGAVFFHLQTGHLFASNITGARIWKGLARNQDVASIAADLSRDYGISYETAHAHTAQFLDELARRDLLQGVEGCSR
jgi:hypothetical protein